MYECNKSNLIPSFAATIPIFSEIGYHVKTGGLVVLRPPFRVSICFRVTIHQTYGELISTTLSFWFLQTLIWQISKISSFSNIKFWKKFRKKKIRKIFSQFFSVLFFKKVFWIRLNLWKFVRKFKNFVHPFGKCALPNYAFPIALSGASH